MTYHSNFSFIRDGFTPSPLQWFSIEDCLPKIREDDYGYNCSKPVLVFLKNGSQFTAYLNQYEDYNPRWILCGRDAYSTDEVTHWRWLPTPPSVWKNKN